MPSPGRERGLRDKMRPMVADMLSEGEARALSIFPLPAATLLPGALLPLHVFEQRYRELVRDALADTKTLAVARLRPGFESDYEGRPPVFDVCGAGRIVEHVEHRDGRYDILLVGLARVRIVSELPPAQRYRVVRGEILRDLPLDVAVASALESTIRALWAKLAPELPEGLRDLGEVTRGVEDAAHFADRLGAVLAGDAELGQTLLSEADPAERLRLIAERLQAQLDSLAPSATQRTRWN
jgi:Lon protease-like protein